MNHPLISIKHLNSTTTMQPLLPTANHKKSTFPLPTSHHQLLSNILVQTILPTRNLLLPTTRPSKDYHTTTGPSVKYQPLLTNPWELYVYQQQLSIINNQTLTTLNHFQPLSTTFNHFQPLSTTFNHSQPLSTTFNHFQPNIICQMPFNLQIFLKI